MHLINYFAANLCEPGGLTRVLHKQWHAEAVRKSAALCDALSPAGDPQMFCSEKPPGPPLTRKVHAVCSSRGKPAQLSCKVSFKEVEKGM